LATFVLGTLRIAVVPESTITETSLLLVLNSSGSLSYARSNFMHRRLGLATERPPHGLLLDGTKYY